MTAKVSYKRLWKLLIDKDIRQADFKKEAGLSSGTMAKLRNSETVSMEVLWKICSLLNCNIEDVVEFVR